jgi:hypothetical protein
MGSLRTDGCRCVTARVFAYCTVHVQQKFQRKKSPLTLLLASACQSHSSPVCPIVLYATGIVGTPASRSLELVARALRPYYTTYYGRGGSTTFNIYYLAGRHLQRTVALSGNNCPARITVHGPDVQPTRIDNLGRLLLHCAYREATWMYV